MIVLGTGLTVRPGGEGRGSRVGRGAAARPAQPPFPHPRRPRRASPRVSSEGLRVGPVSAAVSGRALERRRAGPAAGPAGRAARLDGEETPGDGKPGPAGAWAGRDGRVRVGGKRESALL